MALEKTDEISRRFLINFDAQTLQNISFNHSFVDALVVLGLISDHLKLDLLRVSTVLDQKLYTEVTKKKKKNINDHSCS